ncbi:MAG: hypothetical protein II975_06610 [Bacteroidales bacterium]|nr:hypothetical protein [Bacteroidales bacterium]
MRNVKNNLFGLIFLLSTLFPSLSSFAQNGIYIDTNACIGTITRYKPTGNVPIHYAKIDDRHGKFLFNFQTIQGFPTLYNFKEVHINGYNITDFTVVRDTVYMCGTDTNGRGIYGWMRFFSPTSCQLHVYTLQDDSSFVTNLRRIRVFRTWRYLDVILVGDYINGNSQVNISSIIHVRNNSQCKVAYKGGEPIDDVEVLDNYVVTVARKGDTNLASAPHFMRVILRSGFSLNNTTFHNLYNWSRKGADGRILLQHVGGDSLVSVYHSTSIIIPEININTYSINGSGIMQLHKYYTVPGSRDRVDDVAFNGNDTSLMILQRRVVSRFKWSSFPNLSWTESLYPDMSNYGPGGTVRLMSLSKTSSSEYMASGVVNNQFVVWRTNRDCDITHDYSAVPTSSSMSYYTVAPVVVSLGINATTKTIPINTIYVEEVCSSSK